VNDEVWKAIYGHPGYEASHIGNIRSWCKPGPGGEPAESPRLLRQSLETNGGGYLCVSVRSKRMSVHRLVLLAFEGPPPPGQPQAHHINRDKTDNRRANLVWVSASENINASRSPFTPEQRREIDDRLLAGETPNSIAREYGMHNAGFYQRRKALKKQDKISLLQEENRQLRAQIAHLTAMV
jgi:transposase-like protein